jgi:hypothetical protein
MTITQERPAPREVVRRPGPSPRSIPSTPHGPNELGPLALLDLLQTYVGEVADLLPVAPTDLEERSYELLELTDELEIWAIHWPQGQGLELHDHGGSVGALWVVEGCLEEHYLEQRHTTARRRLVAGGGAAFGASYVHDVVNAQAAPATSLHAYSPPMASMTFYRQDPHGLEVDRTEYRADPSWAP